jgi:predicted Fe-S protein YdhL (DUF1289 family)
MAKKKAVTCSMKKGPLSPCYITDGASSLDKTGKCLGCGRTVEEINNPPVITDAIAKEKVLLTTEQAVTMKRIHKTLFSFFRKMEEAMCNGLLKGKTGWDTMPAYMFVAKAQESFNNILAQKDVYKECIDIANFMAMIVNKIDNS